MPSFWFFVLVSDFVQTPLQPHSSNRSPLFHRWTSIPWRCSLASPHRAPSPRKLRRPTMLPPSSWNSAPTERTGWSTGTAKTTRWEPEAGTGPARETETCGDWHAWVEKVERSPRWKYADRGDHKPNTGPLTVIIVVQLPIIWVYSQTSVTAGQTSTCCFSNHICFLLFCGSDLTEQVFGLSAVGATWAAVVEWNGSFPDVALSVFSVEQNSV